MSFPSFLSSSRAVLIGLCSTATSQLFTSSINVERDYMPASSDGLINDTSIAAFQTSIDDLLEAARSKEPTSVISHARLVVSAVEKIDHDVQAISPSRFNSLSLQDQDIVNSLKAKINATLSNLMTASKNHATSFGVSPVSLLDAAASHLASTVVELVRILKIRRTSASGGHPSRAGSLDPSSASSARFTRDPLPPLHEDSASSYRHPSVSPPVQTRELPSATSPPAPPKSNGYVSGGVSSLVSSSTAGMRNALEAMGIASSSASRSSLEKDRDSIPEPPSAATTTRAYEEEPISSPQSDYGGMQQQQQYNSFQQQQQPNSRGAPFQSSNDDQRFNQYDQSVGQQQYRQDGYEEQRGQQYGGASENGYSGQANGGMDQEYGSPDVRGSETNVDELKVSCPLKFVLSKLPSANTAVSPLIVLHREPNRSDRALDPIPPICDSIRVSGRTTQREPDPNHHDRFLDRRNLERCPSSNSQP